MTWSQTWLSQQWWYRGLRRLLVAIVASVMAHWVQWLFGTVTAVAMAAIALLSHAARDSRPQEADPDWVRQEWRAVAGNRVYSNVPRRIETGEKVVFLPAAEPKRGDEIRAAVLNMRDGPMEVVVKPIAEHGRFCGYARCLDSGKIIANSVIVASSNHNLLTVTCTDTEREGRILELVLAATRSPPAEAVAEAMNQHFWYPYEAFAE